MQGPDKLLRKASVEKLSSPEQLDMMMRVTSPMGWVAVVAIGAMIVVAIGYLLYRRWSKGQEGADVGSFAQV